MLTLSLLDHTCAAVLLMYVWMCAKGGICGVKIRSCMISVPILRSFIGTSPLGLEKDTRLAWVAR